MIKLDLKISSPMEARLALQCFKEGTIDSCIIAGVKYIKSYTDLGNIHIKAYNSRKCLMDIIIEKNIWIDQTLLDIKFQTYNFI